MVNLFKKVLGLGRFLRSRAFAVGALSVVLAATLFEVSSKINAVYIRDGETVSLQFTTKTNVDTILEDQGIVTLACDIVNFSGFNGKVAQISIDRAFPVYVTADGQRNKLMMIDGTVADAFSLAGIQHDSNDLISLSPDKLVEPDDEIVLQRVDYKTYTEQEEIPFEVEYKDSSLLRVGSTKVLEQGSTGHKELTYVDTTIDGVVQETELLGENITRQPSTKVVLKGTRTAISPLDFGYEMDENDKPIGYTQVLTNQVATGYSARPGARTASGRAAITGHVAVNPNVIPYGTKLYITSADNKFIYGYAIAADTGTGLMQGIIDVDLFYDTYAESVLNGRRIVNIYVLS